MARPQRRAEAAEQGAGTAITDVLSQKSMLTPAIAGATTTLITATFSSQFGLPANWTGLTVSLALAFIFLAPQKLPILQRLGYGTMNALVIFSVALGANAAGVAATTNGPTTHAERTESAPAGAPVIPPSPGSQPTIAVPPPSAAVTPPRVVAPRAMAQRQFFHHWFEK